MQTPFDTMLTLHELNKIFVSGEILCYRFVRSEEACVEGNAEEILNYEIPSLLRRQLLLKERCDKSKIALGYPIDDKKKVKVL